MVAVHILLAAHRPRTRIVVLALGVLDLYSSRSNIPLSFQSATKYSRNGIRSWGDVRQVQVRIVEFKSRSQHSPLEAYLTFTWSLRNVELSPLISP